MNHHFKTYSDPINIDPYMIDTRQAKVIGILGEAESGKDTLAKVAKNLHGFKHLAFAYPMKNFMRAAFGLSQYAVHNPYGKAEMSKYWGMSNRKLLQIFGTEAMQPQFGKTVWCKCLHMDLHKYIQEQQQDKFIISDVRFPHEVEYIMRELQGTIIHLFRTNGKSKLLSNEKAHASEAIEKALEIAKDYTSINNNVYHINNYQDFDAYKMQCDHLIRDIMNPPKPNLADRAVGSNRSEATEAQFNRS